MVFYRKYRPQTIDELDLSDVREKLTAILQTQDIPHAFLFTGPKGLGKTSSARILAKAINCERKLEVESGKLKIKGIKENSQLSTLNSQLDTIPCNSCSTCISITNGSNIDVLEIDAASNRGVDEIRELRERVKFTPAQAYKKIYIIDEVHMLTTEAFNALLKTLEEPPAHVVFILATTEMWKLPQTITSRTFVVYFDKPTEAELTRSMKRITTGEKLEIADEVLHEVFQRSEGSFRDAAKMLEELAINSKDQKITATQFEALYKSQAIRDHVTSLLQQLVQKDVKKALATVTAMASSGYDFRVILEELVELLRVILFAKMGVGKASDDMKELSLSDIKALLENTQRAYQEVRFSPLPQLPLELVVIEFCQPGQNNPKIPEKKEVLPEKPTISPTITKDQIEVSPRQAPKSSDFLTNLIEQVKKENHSLAGILRSSKVESESDGKVILSTPYKFHAEKLNDPKVLELLQKKVSEIKGKQYTVEINLKTV